MMSPLIRNLALALVVLPFLVSTVLAQSALPSDKPAASTSNDPVSREYAISEVRTPAGIRLVHMSMPEEKEQVFRMAWRDRSAQHQTDKAGLLILAPILLTLGGAGPLDGGALEEELNDLGGSLGFSRGRSMAFADFSAPVDEIANVAKLFTTVLQTPRLPEIALTRRKRFVASNRIASREKAADFANELLLRIVVGNHPIVAGITLEPPTTVTSISPADIDAWRKTVFARETLTVVSAGPMERDFVVALVDRTFGSLPEQGSDLPAVPFQPQSLGKIIAIERKVEQSLILIGGPTRWRSGGPDGMARNIAMSVLGGSSSSRLFVAVREKLGAAYGSSSTINSILGQNNLFSMQASVSHDKVTQALAAMQEEYRTFRETGVSEAEVEPLKRRMANGFRDSMRKAGSASATIRTGMINELGYDAPNNAARWIRQQNSGRINQLIKERLPENPTIILVVPSLQALADRGIKADCILTTMADLPRCIAP